MAISLLEGEKYPTQSLILFLIHVTEDQIVRLKPEFANSPILNVINDLQTELTSYWDTLPLETLGIY